MRYLLFLPNKNCLANSFKVAFVLSCLLCLAATVPLASAAPVTVQYEANITLTGDGFPSGLILRGTYVFDDAQPPSSNPIVGIYSVISHTVTLGGNEYVSEAPKIIVKNDITSGALLRDVYQVSSGTGTTVLGVLGGYEIMAFGMSLERDANPNNTLTSSALPITLEEITALLPSSAFVTTRNLITDNLFAHHGVVTSISFDTTNTSTGTDVPVLPEATDEFGNPLEESPVAFTFDNVTEGGDTTVEVAGAGMPLPLTFKLGSPPTYYNLETTAVFDGNIEICIDYTDTTFTSEANARLFHFSGSGWDDITTSVDVDANIICGLTTSLSQFTIIESATPEEMLTGLLFEVMSLNLKHGIANAMDAKLAAATDALTDVKTQNDDAAINMLYALINSIQAQSGKGLTIEEADELTVKTEEIIQALSP